MPNFPRNAGALSRLATPPQFPGGLQSWGESGKGQARAVNNMGRVWTETYGTLDATNPSVRALIQAINQARREGTVWDVQHPYWHVRKGVGGGSPVVGSAFRKVWQYDDSATTFVDETADANSAAASDWSFFPATIGANDYAAMGFPVQFGSVSINVGTAGVGTYTVAWEYWNGSAWTALAGVTDNTSAFKTAGTNSVTFTVPSDWAASVLNGSASLYYIRARYVSGSMTTVPLGTQGFIRTKVYGSNLVIDAGPVSVTNWLRQGDIISVVGGAVVFDVAADVNTDANGWATIPISPPIFDGQTPADGAVVTINPASIYFKAMLVDIPPFPDMDVTNLIPAGMTLTFREQPL